MCRMLSEKEGRITMKAAQKRRMVWGDALVALVILAAGVLILFFLPDRGGTTLTAVVTVDGETVLTCPLEELEELMLYTVDGDRPLTLELSVGGVRVVETSCPGEDCRHMGTISAVGQQIVCLPNRTVVALLGSDPSYDAVTG